MSLLTESEVEFITNEIARSSLSEAMKIDLTDHFCCVIEDQLTRGSDFRSAWQLAHILIAPNGLEEIETEKNLLCLTTKTNHMKKSLLIFGFLTTLCFTFTILFKFYHWPGVMILFTITTMLFVFGLLPVVFMLAYHKENSGTTANKLKYILGYFGFALLTAGLIFKFSHWPSANFQIVTGIILLNLGYFPLLFWNMKKKTLSQRLRN